MASRYVTSALLALGVRAHFSPPNRIDVSERKVSGMAARSTRRTLLVHGTLLLNSDLKRLNELCIPPNGCPPVANLVDFSSSINKEVIISAVAECLKDSQFIVRIAEGI